MALAKLRLDGFFCLEAGDHWGRVTTRPFRLDGGTLEVNIDASQGELFVEVLDPDGKPYPGYDGNLNQTKKGVNDLRFAPRWKNDKNLEQLKGKVVKLRFRMKNAKLYAFKIK